MNYTCLHQSFVLKRLLKTQAVLPQTGFLYISFTWEFSTPNYLKTESKEEIPKHQEEVLKASNTLVRRYWALLVQGMVCSHQELPWRPSDAHLPTTTETVHIQTVLCITGNSWMEGLKGFWEVLSPS